MGLAALLDSTSVGEPGELQCLYRQKQYQRPWSHFVRRESSIFTATLFCPIGTECLVVRIGSADHIFLY